MSQHAYHLCQGSWNDYTPDKLADTRKNYRLPIRSRDCHHFMSLARVLLYLNGRIIHVLHEELNMHAERAQMNIETD